MQFLKKYKYIQLVLCVIGLCLFSSAVTYANSFNPTDSRQAAKNRSEFGSAPAMLATVTVSSTVATARTDWDRTIELPKFDPILGTLTGASIVIESDLSGSAGFENLDPAPATVNLSLAAAVTVHLPDDSVLATANPLFVAEEDTGAFDGGVDFAGSSGRFFVGLSASGMSTPATIAAVDLQDFVGRIGQADSITLPIRAVSRSEGSGPVNLALTFLSNVDATVTITYEYDAFTPDLTLEKSTNGADADDPNGADVPRIAVGDRVRWEFSVTNSGTMPFVFDDVDVADNQGIIPSFVAASDANGDNILMPGETWLYRFDGVAENLATAATATVPGCDPTGSGLTRNAYRNVGTVTTSSVSATDPSHYCNPDPVTATPVPTATPLPTATPTVVPLPGLQLEKSTNGQAGEDPNGVDVPIFEPGEPIVWQYLVKNSGNVVFAKDDVLLTDDQGVLPVLDPSSDVGNDALLSPGEQWMYRGNDVALDLALETNQAGIVAGCAPSGTSDQRAALRNIATVSVVGTTVSATDQSHYCNPPVPAIDIEKLTNGVDADAPIGPNGSSILAGSQVEWRYLVRNVGDLSLMQVDVTDDNGTPADLSDDFAPTYLDGDVNGDGKLNLDEVWRYEASGTATVGAYRNVGTGRGTYPAARGLATGGSTIDRDTSHYYACIEPLGFERDGDGTPLSAGTIIDEEWARFGVHISTNAMAETPTMIFDSANPTGTDWDLGSPNVDFGGPGIGSGGGRAAAGFNQAALGKVLIISKDGRAADPNDYNEGGTIFFTFDTPVPITSLVFLDIDEDEVGGTIRAYDERGDLIRTGAILPLGNNSVQTIPLNATDVSRLEVNFVSSGAIAEVNFCP